MPTELIFFPLEQLTKEGTPFWSGPKRAPEPLQFDYNVVSTHR